MELEKTLKDHEERLRRLEKKETEQNIKLVNIEKNLADLKLTVVEGNNKLLDNLIKQTENRTEIKFYNTKQFWAVIAAAGGAIGAFLLDKIN